MDLKWKTEDENLVFFAEFGSGNVPLVSLIDKNTTILLPSGDKATLAPLLLLLEENRATKELDGSIKVDATHLAKLSPSELQGLGLPQMMPYSLEISGSTILTDPEFKFEFELSKPDTRLVSRWSRNASILRVGKKFYTIPSPFYELIRDMEHFNNRDETWEKEEIFNTWADIKEQLPEGVIIDNYLSQMEIRRADALSIEPFVNENGKLGFNPQLLRQKQPSETSLSSDIFYEDSLVPAVQNDFATRFREFKNVRRLYGMQNNVFCVISPELEEALKVVKVFQNKTPSEKVSFVRNPQLYLKEHLLGKLSEERIDEIFRETANYSDRVQEIGIWTPPIIPFLKNESNTWLPEDILVLKIEDKEIEISIQELQRIEAVVRKAIEDGIPSIDIEGVKLPPVQVLPIIETTKAPPPPITQQDEVNVPEDEPKTKEKYGLKIWRNLEEDEYSSKPRRLREVLEVELPRNLKHKPFLHQKVGIRTIQKHWQAGSPGILVADDMGLGKTFQALAFLSWVKDQASLPVLIVAPTGLLKNWEDEHDEHLTDGGIGYPLRAFREGLRNLKKSPSSARNLELESGLPCLEIDIIQKSEWVLTTYETLRDYQISFGKIHWGTIIFDEIQKIKNPKARLTDAAKAMNADFIIGLSGTPVENRITELWCIMDTIHPGLLGSLRDFSRNYEVKDETERNEKLKELKEKLTYSENETPHMLRRLKEDHLDGLPEKKNHILTAQMPLKQGKAYWESVEKAKANSEERGAVLQAIQEMRSISLHPTYSMTSSESIDSFIEMSARLLETIKILDSIKAKDEKVIIFCEARIMQGKLAEIIQEKYQLPHNISIINGQVSGESRKAKVDKFQSKDGFDVLIISPKAGGVGLTITSANHVIHLTRWWNPAVEDQCTDRAYRIGQKKNVHVYYPLAIHPALVGKSFDENLNKLLESKRALNRKVLAPQTITQKDLQSLLGNKD